MAWEGREDEGWRGMSLKNEKARPGLGAWYSVTTAGKAQPEGHCGGFQQETLVNISNTVSDEEISQKTPC